MRAARLLLPALLLCLLALPSAAGAATVGVEGDVLSFSAAPGERNTVVLTLQAGGISVADTDAPVVAGPGCDAVDGAVLCVGATRLVVALGDADDVLQASDMALGVEVDDGPGDDRVATGSGRDVVAGAEGDDDVDTGDGSDSFSWGPGNDRLDGGAGVDELTFAAAPSGVRAPGAGGPGHPPDGLRGCHGLAVRRRPRGLHLRGWRCR
jgi:Ca2+-binding RTX toxin-like protein